MSVLAKTLQLFGLLLLPAALLYGTTSNDPRAVQIEIAALAAGALAFFVGTRLLAKR